MVLFNQCWVALSCYRITPELRRLECFCYIFFEILQNCHVFFGIHPGFIPTFLEIDRQYISTIPKRSTENFFVEQLKQNFFDAGSPFLCQTQVSSFCVRVISVTIRKIIIRSRACCTRNFWAVPTHAFLFLLVNYLGTHLVYTLV